MIRWLARLYIWQKITNDAFAKLENVSVCRLWQGKQQALCLKGVGPLAPSSFLNCSSADPFWTGSQLGVYGKGGTSLFDALCAAAAEVQRMMTPACSALRLRNLCKPLIKLVSTLTKHYSII